MKSLVAFVALVVATARLTTAFPHMLNELGVDLPQFEAVAKRDGPKGIRRLVDNAKRQGATTIPISIPLPALPVPGLPIPTSIDVPYVVSLGIKAIPDSSHPFIAPTSTDQRGGCPGLNIMSNYGYTPRNGIISAGDMLYGTMEMLGYAQDLAQVLVALALHAGAMDPTTLLMSIGGTDSRTNGVASTILGQAPGLFDIKAHNAYEADGSMAFDDSYFHSSQANAGSFFNTTKFAAMQALADSQFNGLYDLEFNAEHRFQSYQSCIANNPTCTWSTMAIIFYGADCYTFLGMPSSDETTKQIGPPDSKSVQTFFGAQKNSDGTFTHVPEKLQPGPDGNWYRRATPLTGFELDSTITAAYARHPVLLGQNQGKVNTFQPSAVQPSGSGVFCFALQQISENDQALGSRFGAFAPNILAVVNTLLAPTMQSLNCPSLSGTTK